MRRFALMCWLLTGCGVNPVDVLFDDTDDVDDTQDTEKDPKDDDDDEPEPESDCDDGEDNDDDGDVDCEDEDCEDAFHCTWPDTMSHETQIFFDGYEIECRIFGGFTVDYTVDDCRTDVTAELVEATDDLCDACDRTFTGPLVYTRDTCIELVPGDRPTDARFGLVFVSPTERELWIKDTDETWIWSADMTSTDGTWVYDVQQELVQDLDDCTNPGITVGNVISTFTFIDP